MKDSMALNCYSEMKGYSLVPNRRGGVRIVGGGAGGGDWKNHQNLISRWVGINREVGKLP